MPVRVINLSGLQGSQNLGVAAYPLVLGHRAIRRPLGLPAGRTGRRCGCEIPGLQLRRAGCWGTQPARGIAGEAMNPAERVARRLDAAQQRHTPTAFVVGVVKKSPMTTAGSWPPPWLIPPLSRFSRCCWCSSRFSVSSRPTTRRCGLATIWGCTGLAQTLPAAALVNPQTSLHSRSLPPRPRAAHAGTGEVEWPACPVHNDGRAPSLGADHVVGYTTDDVAYGEHGCDVIFDVGGNRPLRAGRARARQGRHAREVAGGASAG
jgi:hypothetical protein